MSFFSHLDDFDGFLNWELEIPAMPIIAVSSLNLSVTAFLFLFYSLPRSVISNPPPLPFGPLFFHLNPPPYVFSSSLMSVLGHGDMVPNGISNLCNPRLFL